MEVRVIDSESQSPHHAGRVVGHVVKTISSNRTTQLSKPCDRPAPFSQLIKRALEPFHHARKEEVYEGSRPECVANQAHLNHSGHEVLSPPSRAPKSISHHAGATEPNKGTASLLTKEDFTARVHAVINCSPPLLRSPATCPWNARSEDGAGITGLPASTDAGKQVGYVGTKQGFRSGQPRFNLNCAPVPDSQTHDNSERGASRLSSQNLPTRNGILTEVQLPYCPAPRSTQSQNAGVSEKASPPRLDWSENQWLTRSPCAPVSRLFLISMGVIGLADVIVSPFRRFLLFLKRHTLAERGLIWEYHGTTRVAVRRRKA